MKHAAVTAIVMTALNAAWAQAQPAGAPGQSAGAHSSSLYLMPTQGPVRNEQGQIVNPYMQRASYAAVSLPEPRHFAVHDLVTIIVREASSATVEGELETEKEVTVDGEVSSFIDLMQLLETRVQPADLGLGNPSVGVDFNREFQGEGDYARRDEVITRLTARVIDVKPNGTLALEARTAIDNDDEQMTIKVTGYCRAEDVTAANTILSTQMYDLRVNKQHEGEVRKASKKGLLTKVLDVLFNF